MMKFKAEFKVFVKVNVWATAIIENENPEILLKELEQCGIEVPSVDKLLYHMFVRGFAYAGKSDLLITYN